MSKKTRGENYGLPSINGPLFENSESNEGNQSTSGPKDLAPEAPKTLRSKNREERFSAQKELGGQIN